MKRIVILLLYICCTAAHAQPASGLRIIGQVVDASSGEGLGGVEVKILDESATPPKRLDSKDLATRSNGTYDVTLKPTPGRSAVLRIYFSKTGYVPDPGDLSPDLHIGLLPQQLVHLADRKAASPEYYSRLSRNAVKAGPSTPGKPSPFLGPILSLPELLKTQTLQQIEKLDSKIYSEYSKASESYLAVKDLSQKYVLDWSDFRVRANTEGPGSIVISGAVKSEEEKANVLKELMSKGSGITITDKLTVRNTAKPLPNMDLANMPRPQINPALGGTLKGMPG